MLASRIRDLRVCIDSRVFLLSIKIKDGSACSRTWIFFNGFTMNRKRILVMMGGEGDKIFLK